MRGKRRMSDEQSRSMPDRPVHCFHDRELVTREGTVHYRQCCNCDRILIQCAIQCADTTCDGQRWSTWAKVGDDA
jgi:hypothetical protein